ncbi:uncharacterized [Tachysurus ichikawai]
MPHKHGQHIKTAGSQPSAWPTPGTLNPFIYQTLPRLPNSSVAGTYTEFKHGIHRIGCETAAPGPALPKKARETERKLPFLIFFPAAPNKIQMLCERVIPPFQLQHPASLRLSRS